MTRTHAHTSTDIYVKFRERLNRHEKPSQYILQFVNIFKCTSYYHFLTNNGVSYLH